MIPSGTKLGRYEIHSKIGERSDLSGGGSLDQPWHWIVLIKGLR